MEVIASIIGFLAIIGFFILCNDVGKMRTAQKQTNKFLAEQNNLLSEQINLIKEAIRKDKGDDLHFDL
jgi:hypothetical protein